MKSKMKKSVAFIMLILTIFLVFGNTVFATEITSAQLHNAGDCGHHLQFWDIKQMLQQNKQFIQ